MPNQPVPVVLSPAERQQLEAWSRRRGRDFGVALAEGFRQYRHEPYPTTPRLQELLGEALLMAAS